MMLAEIIKATQKNEVARRATKVPWGWTSTSGIPDSEVSAKAVRRRFTTDDKLISSAGRSVHLFVEPGVLSSTK